MLYAHYDPDADIAWLILDEQYEGHRVASEETEFGLRETDRETGRLVGLEYWEASKRLPADLLELLPLPQAAVAE